MSFLKILMMSGLLWVGCVVPFERDEQQDDFKILVSKAMVVSAATGVMSGLIDTYIFFPVGFCSEIEVRKLILEELFSSNKRSVNELDKTRYARQKSIANWFGWGTSWLAYIITMKIKF